MQEFLIAPATGRAMWFIVLVPGLILLLVIGVLGAAVAGARSARFELSPAGLQCGPVAVTDPSDRARHALDDGRGAGEHVELPGSDRLKRATEPFDPPPSSLL